MEHSRLMIPTAKWLPAAKWGALVGAVLYLVVGLALTALGNALFGTGAASLANNPGKLSLGCLGIFVPLFAFSAAGYLTGRETRRPGLGAVAGMIAFVVYALLIKLYLPGSGTAAPATHPARTHPATTHPQPVAPQLPPLAQALSVFVSVTILLGLAALMGWLGGRPGAQRASRDGGAGQ